MPASKKVPNSFTNEKQLLVIAEKLMELANLILGATAIDQLVFSQDLNPMTALVGIAVFLLIYLSVNYLLISTIKSSSKK